jgi:hypothetical protein
VEFQMQAQALGLGLEQVLGREPELEQVLEVALPLPQQHYWVIYLQQKRPQQSEEAQLLELELEVYPGVKRVYQEQLLESEGDQMLEPQVQPEQNLDAVEQEQMPPMQV